MTKFTLINNACTVLTSQSGLNSNHRCKWIRTVKQEKWCLKMQDQGQPHPLPQRRLYFPVNPSPVIPAKIWQLGWKENSSYINFASRPVTLSEQTEGAMRIVDKTLCCFSRLQPCTRALTWHSTSLRHSLGSGHLALWTQFQTLQLMVSVKFLSSLREGLNYIHNAHYL